jgi:hypothetical protein
VSIKLPSVIHRTQFMRILLTQFIATLAPWKGVASLMTKVQRLASNVQKKRDILIFNLLFSI